MAVSCPSGIAGTCGGGACQNCGDVAASLYNIYLEHEHTRFATWDGIRGLLDIMADRQEGGGA